MTHELKIWPSFFCAVAQGYKTFEIRNNDCGFQVGDVLLLKEYDPKSKTYSGRETYKKITYLYQGEGMSPGYCALGIQAERTK